MKRLVTALLAIGFITACKKKEEPKPQPEPIPVQVSKVTVKVAAYDSLGQTMADHSGIKVQLDISRSATTSTSGEVVFNDVPFGDYFPNFIKDGYEGPPVRTLVESDPAGFSFPVAQRSPWRAENFNGQIVTKDSIPVSFKLDKPIPTGKTVKVALLFHTDNTLNAANYLSVDIIAVQSPTVSNFNITKLPNFKSKLAGLDSNKNFYIKVVPVSYGEYVSNLIAKPALLGDNLLPPDHWLLTKNWK